ncbi:MAG: DUF4388 domain-containing protein [Deltaproteobacteria bacterium]|nr:DUF4388 domain-containing protein [Deltaproteobacteria bacterium]
MAFQGALASDHLISVLQLLSNDEKCGVLRVWEGENVIRIYLHNGMIIYSTGTEKETRLGYLLRCEEMISEKQLWTSLQQAREQKRTLGSLLVERGLVTVKDLERLIRRKVELCLYNLFMWTGGEFEFHEKVFNLEGQIVINIDSMALILEASRRADEMLSIRKVLPGDEIVLEPSDKTLSGELMPVEYAKRRVLFLVDGTRSVRDIIKDVGGDSFDVYQLLSELLVKGYVNKVDRRSDNSSADVSACARIIKTYHEALHVVCEGLERRVGDMVQGVLRQCVDELSPRQRNLMDAFQLENSAEANITAMLERLQERYEPDEKYIFIMNTFEDVLLNLLGRQKSVMSEREVVQTLNKLDELFESIARYRIDSLNRLLRK